MSTTSKQDRQGSRTPADLERKYDLGAMGDRFAEVMGIALDAQMHSEAAFDAIGQTNSVVADLSQKVDEISITVKDLDEGTLAELSVKVNTISMSVDGLNKNVNSAEFVIGVINGTSTAKISANRLDIVGKKLNIKVDATNIYGKLTADQINVTDLSALNATIGGWRIDEKNIFKVWETTLANSDDRMQIVSIASPSKDTDKVFYIDDLIVSGTDTSITESHPFYVRADGYLHSEYGDIGGWTINPSSLSKSSMGGLGETYETLLSPSALKFSATTNGGNETSVSLSSSGIVLHKESLYGVMDKFCFLTLYLADGVGVELYVDQYGVVSGKTFGNIVTI